MKIAASLLCVMGFVVGTVILAHGGGVYRAASMVSIGCVLGTLLMRGQARRLMLSTHERYRASAQVSSLTLGMMYFAILFGLVSLAGLFV